MRRQQPTLHSLSLLARLARSRHGMGLAVSLLLSCLWIAATPRDSTAARGSFTVSAGGRRHTLYAVDGLVVSLVGADASTCFGSPQIPQKIHPRVGYEWLGTAWNIFNENNRTVTVGSFVARYGGRRQRSRGMKAASGDPKFLLAKEGASISGETFLLPIGKYPVHIAYRTQTGVVEGNWVVHARVSPPCL